MTPNNSPIFVTGTQRSGTTLLHHIVGCSKSVWSRNEMYEVHELIFDEVRDSREQQLREQLKKFLKIDLSDLSYADTPTGRCQLLADTMQRSAEATGKQRWCLKDPRASYYLDQYARAIPSAKFVILVRDPRAVCRSYLDRRGFIVGRPANWFTGAERWNAEVTHQLTHRDEHPERVLIVRYDHLVTKLEDEVRRVCEFVDIEFDADMLNYFDQSASIKIHGGNENILAPPDPSKIDAWRASLSQKQVQVIESVASATMDRLGFDCEYPPMPISGFYRFASRAHDRLVREYRWQMHKWLS